MVHFNLSPNEDLWGDRQSSYRCRNTASLERCWGGEGDFWATLLDEARNVVIAIFRQQDEFPGLFCGAGFAVGYFW